MKPPRYLAVHKHKREITCAPKSKKWPQNTGVNGPANSGIAGAKCLIANAQEGAILSN